MHEASRENIGFLVPYLSEFMETLLKYVVILLFPIMFPGVIGMRASIYSFEDPYNDYIL